jgi:hypothetical protein
MFLQDVYFLQATRISWHRRSGGYRQVEKKMESVICISDYKDDCIVKYATSFQDKALTWWNSEVQTRGWEVVDLMTWEELKAILLEKFCPGNEVQKLEAEFWNLEMKGADVLTYNNRFSKIARLGIGSPNSWNGYFFRIQLRCKRLRSLLEG